MSGKKKKKKRVCGEALSHNINADQNTRILLVTNYLTFVVVCCITASGFKVILFSRLVEKASI